MPRALHVLGRLDPGGVERWLRDTVRHRGESDWHFDFCLLGSRTGAYEPELEALGCRILRCPLTPRAAFPSRLFRTLRRERPDVVHSHVHHFSAVILAVARAAGVPVRIAHSHTHYTGPATSLVRSLYERAAHYLLAQSMTTGLACSPKAADFAGDASRSRVQVLACGIDLGDFGESRSDRSTFRRDLGIPLEAAVVGHVGRLSPEKNQAFLIRSFAALARCVPLAYLVIVGAGPMRSELESLARRLRLSQQVIFTGARDDVAGLLRAFDAFVLPSLREGLPAVVLEAQAAGLPTVVSQQTPREAIVVPELVERRTITENPEEWAAALARALQRARGIPQENCKRLRQARFDVAESFTTLTKLYQHLLEDPSHITKMRSLSWNRSMPPI